MPDEGTLKITTAVDLSGLQTGMTGAASIVQTTTNQMASDAQSAAARVKAAQLDLASAQQQMGAWAAAGNAEAAASIASYEAALAEATAALNAESEAAATNVVAIDSVATSHTQARFAAQLLARDLGVAMPRALSSVAAQSEMLAPLLQAAFPVVAGIALIEVLVKVAEKIGTVIDSLGGWDAKTKEVYAEIEAENVKIYNSYEHVAEQIDHIKNIGKTGSGAAAATQDEVAASIARVNHELGINKQALADAEVAVTKWMAPFDTAAHHLEDEAEKNIPFYREQIQRLTLALNELNMIKRPTAAADAGKVATTDNDALDKAKIENQHKVDESIYHSRVDYIKQWAEQERASGVDEAFIIADTLKRTVEADQQKLVADRAYYDAKKSLAEREGRTGKDVRPELSTLVTDEALATDEAIRKGVEAQRMAEKEYEELYRKQVEKAKQAQEAIAKIFGTLGGPIGEIGKEWERESQVEREAAGKTLEDAKRIAMEKLALAKETANNELKAAEFADDEALKHGRMSSAQWAQAKIDAINKWKAEQLQAIDAVLAANKRSDAEELQAYKKLKQEEVQVSQQAAQQIEKIQDQQEQKAMQLYKTLANTVANSLNQMLTSHKKFSQEVIQLGDAMLMDLIKFGEQELIAYLGNLVKKDVLDKVFATQKKVTTAVSNDATIVSDAGAAAAAAFASVMEALPFPANVAAAPGVAAAAFAQTLSFVVAGSAAQGGIVPINAHAGEMILPAHISRWVQNAAGEGGKSGASHSFHIAPTFISKKDFTEADIARHSRTIAATVEREHRKFNR